MNSTTLKQMTKDERLNQWKPKIYQPAQKFVKCSHLNIRSFLCPQNCSALFVSCSYIFIICCLTNFCCFACSQA